MNDEENVIFDLTIKDCIYRGVFFGELDNDYVNGHVEDGMPKMPKEYIVGVMALIWTDPQGIWHIKTRLKFPSGNKQVVEKVFSEEVEEKKQVNETYVLQHLYKIPMVRKIWTRNPSGKPEGIVEIIKNLNMVESMTLKDENGKVIGSMDVT